MSAESAAAKAETVRSAAAYLDGVSADPAWPLELFLEVSNICDLKCAMCPTFSPLNPKRADSIQSETRGLMDLESFEPRLDALLRHALVVHAFGYGEPTIHPRFKALLERLARYDVWIDFFTHGMHIDAEMAAFLVERGIGRVTFSFSGVSKEEYENIYLGGDFARVLAAMDHLQSERQRQRRATPEIHVNAIGFEHQIRRLPDFVALMADHGVDAIHLKPLDTYDSIPELHGHASSPQGDFEQKALQQAHETARQRGVWLLSREYEAFELAAESKAGRAGQGHHKGDRLLRESTIPLENLAARARETAEQAKAARRQAPPAEPMRFSREPLPEETPWMRLSSKAPLCIEPLKTLYLDLNGNIKPCCFADGRVYNVGDLARSEGKAVWDGDPFRNVRRALEQRRYPAALCKYCIAAVSYPKLMPGRVLSLFVTATRVLRPLRPWSLASRLALIYARLLKPPKGALFLYRYATFLLWVGAAMRGRKDNR